VTLSKRINQCVHSRIGGGVGQRDPKSKLIIVYASEVHTKTRLVRKTCTLELDFKQASNGCFWPDLRYLKTRKGQTCLPLLSEILKTASLVTKKDLLGGNKQCINYNNYSSVCLLVLQTEYWWWFSLKINLNYALETMHRLSLAGCTNWVIILQTGVEWLFLAWFKVSKDPKRPDMSSFIVRDPQNCLSSHEKKPGGGTKQCLQSCRVIYWLY
jgi:hypothetical protein